MESSPSTADPKIPDLKASIRKTLKQKRLQLSVADRDEAAERILKYFSRLPRHFSWLMYAPIHGELPTDIFFDWAVARGNRVFFPKVVNDDLLFFEVKTENDLEPGVFCPEPTGKTALFQTGSPAIALIPGLAFSRTGHRIGYGKGFYDRFLAAHSRLPRFALAYDFQIVTEDWPADLTDQKMDMILTPKGIWGSRRQGAL